MPPAKAKSNDLRDVQDNSDSARVLFSSKAGNSNGLSPNDEAALKRAIGK